MDTLEPETTSGGGLFVPGKDRMVFKPPEKKSLLGACKCFVSFYSRVYVYTYVNNLPKFLCCVNCNLQRNRARCTCYCKASGG